MARFEVQETGDSSFTVYDNTVAESYKSRHAAHTESMEIFLRPGLLEHPRFDQDDLTVVEFGFGLGTNFLQLCRLARNGQLGQKRIRFISCELDLAGLEFFLAQTETRASLMPKELADLEELFTARSLCRGELSAELRECEFVEYLESSACPDFDVIFFDPFSPSSAPECWAPSVFRAVAQKSAFDARLVTYSVARAAKDGAHLAGFHWEKRPVPEILHKRSSLLARRISVESRQNDRR